MRGPRVGARRRRDFKRYRSCKAVLERAEQLLQSGAGHDIITEFFVEVGTKQPITLAELLVRSLDWEKTRRVRSGFGLAACLCASRRWYPKRTPASPWARGDCLDGEPSETARR